MIWTRKYQLISFSFDCTELYTLMPVNICVCVSASDMIYPITHTQTKMEMNYFHCVFGRALTHTKDRVVAIFHSQPKELHSRNEINHSNKYVHNAFMSSLFTYMHAHIAHISVSSSMLIFFLLRPTRSLFLSFSVYVDMEGK